MSEDNVPIEGLGPGPDNKEPEKPASKEIELWEFTCRTCNGKFASNIYEPRFCLLCGANLHFE